MLQTLSSAAGEIPEQKFSFVGVRWVRCDKSGTEIESNYKIFYTTGKDNILSEAVFSLMRELYQW
jgi:hypothetical protein